MPDEIDLFVISLLIFELIVTGATCGEGNAHSFRNTGTHEHRTVHDFTHSL